MIRTIATILAVLTAAEFFYIFYLETLVPTSKKTSEVFKIPQDTLRQDTVKTLLKNQGVYNGLLGADSAGSVLLCEPCHDRGAHGLHHSGCRLRRGVEPAQDSPHAGRSSDPDPDLFAPDTCVRQEKPDRKRKRTGMPSREQSLSAKPVRKACRLCIQISRASPWAFLNRYIA